MANIRQVKVKKGYAFQADVRVAGYKRVIKTFRAMDFKTAKQAAKNWASEIELQMYKGEYKEIEITTITGTSQIDTIGELIEHFRKYEVPNRYEYPEKYNIMLDWWKEKIGHLKPQELNRPIVSECKILLSEEEIEKPLKGNKFRSASTINKYMYLLSSVINYGIEEFGLFEYNPVHSVGKRRKSKEVELRARFLSENELETVASGSKNKSYMLFVFISLALHTGKRYSEVQHLKVEDFDFKNYQIYFYNTKNRTNIGFPLTKKLAARIKAYFKIYNITEGYLFFNKNRDCFYYLKGQFERMIKDCKIEDFRFHDLRHTAASYFLMSGGSETELMELFGWSSRAMVKRYAHLSKKHTAWLVNKATKLFF